MEVELLFLRVTLKNMTAYFSDSEFTGLELKRFSVTFNIKGVLSWYISHVNAITNSYRLNLQKKSQMIVTHCNQSKKLHHPRVCGGVWWVGYG